MWLHSGCARPPRPTAAELRADTLGKFGRRNPNLNPNLNLLSYLESRITIRIKSKFPFLNSTAVPSRPLALWIFG